MRVLVTGGAGFIGAAVCARLLERGDAVTALDSLNDAYDVRLKEWRLARLEGRPGLRFVRADVADEAAVRAAFEEARRDGGFGAVVNLAARAGIRPSVDAPRAYYETNVVGTITLLEACRAFGVPRFVLASSSSVYGDSARVPFREDDPPGRLLSPYAASKQAAEELCRVHARLHGTRTTVLRYFTVFGPAGRPDMSPFRFVQWAFEGRPVRLLDFLRLVEKAAGRPVTLEHLPPSPADVPATWADISRARAELGWSPKVTCEEGVERLAAWYRENREWAAGVRTG